jgi:hypothetical protein
LPLCKPLFMRVFESGAECYPDKAECYPDKAECYPDAIVYGLRVLSTRRNAIPLRVLFLWTGS